MGLVFRENLKYLCISCTLVLKPSFSKGSSWNEQPRSRYSADMDTSDEDVKGALFPAYPPHHMKRRSRASSQENVSHSGNQVPNSC